MSENLFQGLEQIVDPNLPPPSAPPAPPVDVNAMAKRLLKEFEGCSLKPYHGAADRPGVWTIGYGNIDINGVPVTASTAPLTQEQADQLLDVSVMPRAACVDQYVKVKLTEAQRAALISFVYNEGEHAFEISHLLYLLNSGNPGAAANEFDKWVVSNGRQVQGLVNRRAKEKAVFLGTMVV